MGDCTSQGWRTKGHKLKRSSVGDPAQHSSSLTPAWTHLAPCPAWRLSPCPVDQHHPQLQPGILHSSLQCPRQQGDQRPGLFLFSLFLLLIRFHVVLLSSSSKSFEHTQVKERITEVASTYMPTYLEKKSNEVVDNDGSANKLTVVKYLPSDDSNSEKSVGSDQSIDIKSEKETKGLDEDLSKRYV